MDISNRGNDHQCQTLPHSRGEQVISPIDQVDQPGRRVAAELLDQFPSSKTPMGNFKSKKKITSNSLQQQREASYSGRSNRSKSKAECHFIQPYHEYGSYQPTSGSPLDNHQPTDKLPIKASMLYKDKQEQHDSKSQNPRRGMLPQLRTTGGVINQNSEINGNAMQNQRFKPSGSQIVYSNLNPSRNKDIHTSQVNSPQSHPSSLNFVGKKSIKPKNKSSNNTQDEFRKSRGKSRDQNARQMMGQGGSVPLNLQIGNMAKMM